jgi:hypothetical protein
MTKQHAFQRDFWRGAVDILPLAAGVAIYGLAFGLLAAQASLTALQVGVMGGVVFAGGSQIVVVRRNLVLKFKDVLEGTFEAVRAKMSAAGRIDQLSHNAQSVPGLADGALQRVTNPKFATDPLHIHRFAFEGEITEVSYLFARPGDPAPVAKVSFVTRVGDIYCGVGYYKK